MFLLLCPDCCRKVGVPDLCLPLCYHTFNLIEFLDKAHASCSDHLQSIVRCDAGVYWNYFILSDVWHFTCFVLWCVLSLIFCELCCLWWCARCLTCCFVRCLPVSLWSKLPVLFWQMRYLREICLQALHYRLIMLQKLNFVKIIVDYVITAYTGILCPSRE